MYRVEHEMPFILWVANSPWKSTRTPLVNSATSLKNNLLWSCQGTNGILTSFYWVLRRVCGSGALFIMYFVHINLVDSITCMQYFGWCLHPGTKVHLWAGARVAKNISSIRPHVCREVLSHDVVPRSVTLHQMSYVQTWQWSVLRKKLHFVFLPQVQLCETLDPL